MNAQGKRPEPPRNFEAISLVHVVRQYKPMIGGLEDFVHQLVAHQKGRFGNLKVVTLDRLFIEPDKILPHRERIDGVEICRIPFRGSSRYPIAPGVFSQLAGADLVHVHAVDFFFDALAWSSPFHRKPLVATTHGGFFHTQALQGVKKIWMNSVTRLSASRYRGIACCSDSDLAMFRKITPSKARLIENGVNLDKFQDAASKEPAKRLITIGRFSANKRLERLLDVMTHLGGWHLDIVGGPSDISADELEEQVRARGLAGQVAIHVNVSDAEIRSIMSGCSFFVSASEYEGFGIAMIEGLSAGLVPIVEPNQAFRSLAQKHPMVLLASFSDPADTANKILSAWNQRVESPDIRARSVNSAAQHGWQATISQYDTLYREALAG